MSVRTIAITGKGGSGKTVLAALLILLLSGKEEGRLLAIDADSAVSLPQALGVEVEHTISGIRERIITDPRFRKEVEAQHIREVVSGALTRGRDFDLLVMGRPEGPGCFCSVNDLLRYGIENLSRSYKLTIIDCEAGPEQISRRVVEQVDSLVIVTDTSARSLNAAQVIATVAASQKPPPEIGVVINRVREKSSLLEKGIQERGLKVWGFVPEDENITRWELEGRPLSQLPENSPSRLAVTEIARRMGLA
jgi:CO dehydrogenase maturation factor